jgi:dTMP kinase
VARLIVIEGLDGAGKRTLADNLTVEFGKRGASTTRIAFPRYGEDVHADLVRDAMYLRLGDLVKSVHGMAVLFALDRKGAAERIESDLAEHDVVLLDRYIASNAAYGAARLHQDARGEFAQWVHDLEIDRFGLRVPDAQLLLRVPVEVAAQRAAQRESQGRARDSWESDDGLQTRCAEVYDQFVEDNWLAPWHVVDGVATTDYGILAERLLPGADQV